MGIHARRLSWMCTGFRGCLRRQYGLNENTITMLDINKHVNMSRPFSFHLFSLLAAFPSTNILSPIAACLDCTIYNKGLCCYSALTFCPRNPSNNHGQLTRCHLAPLNQQWLPSREAYSIVLMLSTLLWRKNQQFDLDPLR